jgi:bifunctional DNA-binding transcriptional regulator/antitoxin component of YhaV-PrlF toxin-antitoxin module
MSHRFTTKLEEDDFGDLIVTIPYEVCEELGWDIGSELDYEISDDNTSFTLKKTKDD